ncbi:MAG: hypothetical protein J5802_09835 [Butyrivibrio sp.]|nr:hypothetical protein [Butyrivibrio sp.]
MEKSYNKYTNETLNLRCFYLRLLGKLWILPVAAVVGALIGAGLYLLVTVTFGPGKMYECTSKLCLSYSYSTDSEKLIEMLDNSYNAYTWNNDILTTDVYVMNPVMEELQKTAPEITKEEVIASTEIELPSDKRFMHVVVTNSDPDKVEKITSAMLTGLTAFGENFDPKKGNPYESIWVIQTDPVKVISTDQRLGVATIVGAVAFIILTFFALMIFSGIDEAIFVPEDCENRYGLPVLGILFKDDEKNEIFRNELSASYEKYVAGADRTVFISTDSVDSASASEKDLESLKKVIGSEFESSLEKVTALSVPGKVLENYRNIGTADGVILSVPYGKRNATMTEHLISQLQKHECPIFGIVFSRADLKFIKRYYRVK